MLEKSIFLGVLIIFMAIRIHWRKIWMPIERQKFHDVRERRLTTSFALSMMAVSLLWLATDSLSFAQLQLLPVLRWVGLGLALAGLLLLMSVHSALGSNFSPRLELQDEHQLIQNGPYRWIRHPMYTSGFLFVVGCGVWSSNIVVLIVPLLSFSFLVWCRLRDEEEMLQNRFGEQWAAHCQRTGRLWPRIW